MKKTLLFIIGCFFIAAAFGQGEVTRNIDQGRKSEMSRRNPIDSRVPKDSSISNIPPCFCCEGAYNLPKPVISGPTSPVCACDPIKFSTKECPGAKFNWIVKDNFGNNITYSNSGNSITLNYSLAQQIASGATSITVTLQLSCGNKTITTTQTITLKPIPPTVVNFSLNITSSGNYTANVSAVGIATGLGNGWTLKEVNCPGPNPCSWVPGAIKWQSTGSNITIPNGVLVNGKCYVLTHYVNVCSPQWIAGPCTVYKAICFTVSGNQAMRMAAPNPNDIKDSKLVTKEMLMEISEIKAEK